MKKNIIILFCALFGGLSAVQAQLTVSSVYAIDQSYHFGYSEAIVRSWNQNYAISTFRDDSTQYYFELIEAGTNPTPSARQVKIPNGIYITDFQVADDSVFFCGYKYGNGPVAIMGWFDVARFAVLPFADFEYIEVPEALYMTHIVAYMDKTGKHRIVSLGKDTASSDMLVVEMSDFSNIAPLYTIAPIQAAEGISNLVVTDNYVVLIGDGWGTYPDALIFRRADRNNVINSGMLDERFDYEFNTNVPEATLDIVATAMFNDDFAIAYQHKDTNGTFRTMIRTFGVYPMVDMYNGQSFATTEKSYPLDIAYMPIDNSLVVLSYDELIANMTFTYIDPSNYWTYSSVYTYLDGEDFFSLTTNDNDYYIAAGYGASWFAVNKTATMPLSSAIPPPMACPDAIGIQIDYVGEIPWMYNYVPLNSSKYSAQINNYSQWYSPSAANLRCVAP